MVRIGKRQCKRMANYARCLREVNAMLLAVRPGFTWIPFKLHLNYTAATIELCKKLLLLRHVLGGVPRVDLGRRVDVRLRVVHGDSGFTEAGGDELEFAGVVDNVAGGVDAGEVRFHTRRDMDGVADDL